MGKINKMNKKIINKILRGIIASSSKRQISLKLKATFLAFSIFPLISNAHIAPNLSAVASLYPDTSKVVNVTDGEEKLTFGTDKNTLGEALQNQGVDYTETDIIEPSLNTKIDKEVTNVTIKKTYPVTIIDGSKVIISRSEFLSAQDILKDLSINLYANDKVEVANPLGDINPGLEIIIDRANTINLQIDGTLREIHTRLDTVSDLLYSENIILGERDRVEPTMDVKLYNNMSVIVIRVLENQNLEIVDIPFSVEIKKDPNMADNESRIERAGVVGKKEVLFNKTIENGVEISRQSLSERILQEPVSQITIKGTKPRFSYASGSFSDIINNAALQYGVDAGKMQRVMMCESGGNANSVSRSGKFHGLFQYMQSTWAGASAGAGWGGASIYNPEAQIYTTAWKISRQGYGAWPVCGRR